jgi:hypothetical protein
MVEDGWSVATAMTHSISYVGYDELSLTSIPALRPKHLHQRDESHPTEPSWGEADVKCVSLRAELGLAKGKVVSGAARNREKARDYSP